MCFWVGVIHCTLGDGDAKSTELSTDARGKDRFNADWQVYVTQEILEQEILVPRKTGAGKWVCQESPALRTEFDEEPDYGASGDETASRAGRPRSVAARGPGC